MSKTANALGHYLRARRELIDPAQAGLAVVGVRRTPGLRREEVATLAGISADYYLRLEQGRDRNPSPQVLEALARVLRLDAAATEHLLSLAAARPTPARRVRRETVAAGIRQLLDVINLPAFVESRTFEVLAANRLATAVSPNIRPGANRLRAIFLDPGEQELYPDWEQTARNLVAGFRASVGSDVEDQRIVQLVGELSLASEQFRRLWARHDVTALAGGAMRLNHPVVGMLELRREKLPLADSGGQILAIYHAERGSEAARRLERLERLDRLGAEASTAQETARQTA
ncbi:helix-turn-helix domain-containing protein [Actinospica sp. MGRD01-02]|uniref:Helix-turn-helix domain-containing protein n=1 Tax=Actinospica acidithermotolerans TaxID=2828514 RepID=A0A941ECM6_9ACTN|nr:helix-turn-helix transcriptional regulator [Actinospica acidithermotolerans]MBR7826569.1 helix-turn-helix domain-containing protein [Actinospica acidithermotolerans]